MRYEKYVETRLTFCQVSDPPNVVSLMTVMSLHKVTLLREYCKTYPTNIPCWALFGGAVHVATIEYGESGVSVSVGGIEGALVNVCAITGELATPLATVTAETVKE